MRAFRGLLLVLLSVGLAAPASAGCASGIRLVNGAVEDTNAGTLTAGVHVGDAACSTGAPIGTDWVLPYTPTVTVVHVGVPPSGAYEVRIDGHQQLTGTLTHKLAPDGSSFWAGPTHVLNDAQRSLTVGGHTWRVVVGPQERSYTTYLYWAR